MLCLIFPRGWKFHVLCGSLGGIHPHTAPPPHGSIHMWPTWSMSTMWSSRVVVVFHDFSSLARKNHFSTPSIKVGVVWNREEGSASNRRRRCVINFVLNWLSRMYLLRMLRRKFRYLPAFSKENRPLHSFSFPSLLSHFTQSPSSGGSSGWPHQESVSQQVLS